MATATAIRERIYDYVYGGPSIARPFESILGAAYDNVTTSITVLDGTYWDTGDILENSLTGEQSLVLSKAGNVLTVVRGYRNTTKAASSGADDLIRKSPRFSQKQVDEATTESITNLQAWGIHGFGYGTLTMVDNQYYYNLGETNVSSLYGVLSVYYPEDTTQEPIALPFNMRAKLSSTPAVWSSIVGVTLLSKGDRVAGEFVYYTYAKDPADVTELSTEQEEIVVLGVVTRMLGHAITPSTQDPGARTDRTVQPGQYARDGRWFQGEFFIKARAEAARLGVIRRQQPGSVRTKRARRWRS